VTSASAFSLTADERRRIEQIDRLVALGAAGVHELLGAMSDASWTVRRATVAGLIALGDDATGPLTVWLRERRTSENAIAAAVDALAGSIGGGATRAVVGLLGDANPAVVCDAAQILGRRRAVTAAAEVGRLVDHGDDNVAVAAIEALGAIGGSAAVEPLIAALARHSFFRSFAVLEVLPKTGDPRAIAPLTELLGDETYRLEAVRALGRTGSALAIAPIASLLSAGGRTGGEGMVRLIALALADLVARAEWTGSADRVVAEMRPVIAPRLDRFVGALRAADPAERTAIASLLGRFGDAAALPALARLLDDAAMVDTATEAIQRISRADDAAMLDALRATEPAARVAVLPAVTSRRIAPDVRGLLGDDDPEVRARACDALARIGDTSAVPALFALLGDGHVRVAHAAAGAIQSLGTADTGALALAALTTGSPAVQRQALRIIGYLGCDGTYQAVRAAVDDRDPRIAELAVTALGSLDDSRIEQVLAELSRHADERLRAAAMRAAAQRSTPQAAELLERGLADDAAWVRYYACQGLGRIGDPRAASALVARLADSTPHVRIAAIEALARLDTPAAWQALSSIARSPDPDQQRAALVGIGLRSTVAALPFLIEAAGSVDPATRLIAISGLARRDEPEALAALGAAVRDPEPGVGEAALSLLGERSDAAAAALLVALALALDPADAAHPVHLVLSRPSRARIAAIQAALAGANDRDVGVLVAALARMRDAAATAALFQCLALGTPAVRRIAATALIAMDAAGARVQVQKLATDDPDPDVRRACAAAVA
jgi:HEAT repeat protein